MSIAKIFIDSIGWGEFSHILLFLDINDLWNLGKCNKFSFVTFLREKSFRKSDTFKNLLSSPHIRVKFLPHGSLNDKVLLTSYPRSGNSFLRKVFEESSSIITGSDSRPNRSLTAKLLEFGYRGEGVTGNSVWIVKSHYPERTGYIRVVAQRVIVLIRNPFDSIESYFNMGMTDSHNKTLSQKAFESLSSIWTEFVRHESKIWTDFYKFWLEKADQVPVFFVRYEDLLVDLETQKVKIQQFLCEGNPPNVYLRMLARQRKEQQQPGGNQIAPLPNTGGQAKGYSPRVGSIGKSLDRMSKDHIVPVIEATSQLLKLFGYEVLEEGDNHYRINLKSFDQPSGHSISGSISTGKFSVREDNDKFGRKLSELRMSLTAMDKKPFETS